jgi:hypothetical protein
LVFPESASSVEKSCPRDTFLALCETDAIRGVEPRAYTKSVRNKSYAMKALELVKNDPGLLDNIDELWKAACSDDSKAPNHQMEVVSALWKHGWLK